MYNNDCLNLLIGATWLTYFFSGGGLHKLSSTVLLFFFLKMDIFLYFWIIEPLKCVYHKLYVCWLSMIRLVNYCKWLYYFNQNQWFIWVLMLDQYFFNTKLKNYCSFFNFTFLSVGLIHQVHFFWQVLTLRQIEQNKYHCTDCTHFLKVKFVVVLFYLSF